MTTTAVSRIPATPVGAVTIHDELYLKNAKGDLVAVANIKAQDLLMHELVYKIAAYAEDLSAEIARFADHTYADVGAFDALLAQEYGVERQGSRGNRTLTSFDGERQVKVRVQDLTTFGPELHHAKDLLDAIIRDRSEGADPFLVTLVGQAFKVGKEGYVDASAIRALRNLEVDDPRWPDVQRAIDDAGRVRETKRYVQVYRRDAAGEMKLIPLDIAAAKVRPEDAGRRSLRRTVEHDDQVFDAIRSELQRARDGGLDIADDALIGEAVGLLVDDALQLLNINPTERETREAMGLIAGERTRQLLRHDEGHDDSHDEGELAVAAAAYALQSLEEDALSEAQAVTATLVKLSPCQHGTPGAQLRNLVKAGALIVAEIERLQRLAQADAVAEEA